MRYSVIVPIYKVEEYLEKCIESILSQSYEDFELILVDDGSPDLCPLICDRYAERDNRIKVIHKENGGLVSARNTGLREANGEYICYVDGDDWIKKNLLENIENRAINVHNPDVVIFGAERIYEDNKVEIKCGLPEGYYNKREMENSLYPYMMYDNRREFCEGLIFPVAWNKIYKRELLLEHYCEDERIKMGEDNAFVFEVLFFANSTYFIDESFYCYNQLNVNSFIHRYDPNRFDNNKYLTDYISSKLSGYNDVMNNQINAFKAYWTIMAVFHEIKSEIPLFQARSHIKNGIERNGTVKDIKLSGLPFKAKFFILLLKMKMFMIAIVGAKMVNRNR